MKKSFKINDLFDKDLAFNKAIFTVCGTAFTAFDDDNLIEQRFSGFTDRDSVYDNERRDEINTGILFLEANCTPLQILRWDPRWTYRGWRRISKEAQDLKMSTGRGYEQFSYANPRMNRKES